jgi:hypothetical protein
MIDDRHFLLAPALLLLTNLSAEFAIFAKMPDGRLPGVLDVNFANNANFAEGF